MSPFCHLRSSRGFGNLTLMAMLPFLLTVLLAGSLFATHLKDWNQQHHFCHQQLLEHQNRLRSHLVKLLRLNPKARSLRLQEKAARIALRAALASRHPAAISAAQLNLQRIHKKQGLLDQQQKLILTWAKSEALKFKTQIRLQLQKQKPQFHSSPQTPSYPLAVRALPPMGLAPEYIPVADFAQHQSLGLEFEWHPGNPNSALPEFIGKIECGSTIRKEAQKWYTHLNAVRPLWKL